MKKSFFTAIALGLVFAFGANAQIIEGSKQVAKGTKKATIKGAKATKRASVKVAKTTKKYSVKGYKGTKKLVKKVF
jgi:hypothetical protein